MALPDPPVPADADCRQLDGFLLNVERLLASELWALSTGDELKAAIGLWCRAWKQVPAGSLPDDERILASFSGAGRGWAKVREMALHGFVKCSDGRLYHLVLCEDVKRAIAKVAQYQERRETDRERLAKWRKDRGLSEGKWMSLRAAVFKRDGNRCVQCGSGEDLHCDHVIEAADGGTSELDNLATLCRTCHGRKTASRRHHEMHHEMHFDRRIQGQDREGNVVPNRIPKTEPYPEEGQVNGKDGHPLVQRCALPAAAPNGALKIKKKDLLRQKLVRFCNATLSGDEATQAMLGLMGEDPERSAQQWLDELDLKRKAARWDDTREWKQKHLGAMQ